MTAGHHGAAAVYGSAHPVCELIGVPTAWHCSKEAV